MVCFFTSFSSSGKLHPKTKMQKNTEGLLLLLIANVPGFLCPGDQVLVAWPLREGWTEGGKLFRFHPEHLTPSQGLSRTSPRLPGSTPSSARGQCNKTRIPPPLGGPGSKAARPARK